MKNNEKLTTDEQIKKMQKENKFALIFGISWNLLVTIGIVLIWLFVGWQLALHFLIAIPISGAYNLLVIRRNRRLIAKLKENQMSSNAEVENEK